MTAAGLDQAEGLHVNLASCAECSPLRLKVRLRWLVYTNYIRLRLFRVWLGPVAVLA